MEGPFPGLLTGILATALLAGGGITTAYFLGLDVDWAKNGGQDAGVAVASWLGSRVARIVLILVLGTLAIRASSRLMPPLLSRLLSHRASGQEVAGEVEKRECTLAGVVTGSVKILVITAIGFIILSESGINLAPLLAAAGVAGITIGFGTQSLVRDIFSGIFILLEDQYRVGDVVRIGGVAGLVEDVNLRRTTLRDLDYIQHVIPNGEVRVASNFTKEKSRVNLNISVAYKEDLDKVIEVINRVGQKMAQDPDFSSLITAPLKALHVDAFEESGIAIKVLGKPYPFSSGTWPGGSAAASSGLLMRRALRYPFPTGLFTGVPGWRPISDNWWRIRRWAIRQSLRRRTLLRPSASWMPAPGSSLSWTNLARG